MALTDGPMDLAQIGGGVAQAGMGAATGNPIAMIAGIAGIATSIFGTLGESNAQKQESQVSQQIAGEEQAINNQRQVIAQNVYQRQQTENMRKTQQAVAMSKAAAVNQGGQFGSGAAGGQAQAVAEGAFNQQNLGEQYVADQRIFGITNQIDANQIKLAQLQGTASTDAGIASIGGSVTSGAMSLGRLTGGFGGSY